MEGISELCHRYTFPFSWKRYEQYLYAVLRLHSKRVRTIVRSFLRYEQNKGSRGEAREVERVEGEVNRLDTESLLDLFYHRIYHLHTFRMVPAERKQLRLLIRSLLWKALANDTLLRMFDVIVQIKI